MCVSVRDDLRPGLGCPGSGGVLVQRDRRVGSRIHQRERHQRLRTDHRELRRQQFPHARLPGERPGHHDNRREERPSRARPSSLASTEPARSSGQFTNDNSVTKGFVDNEGVFSTIDPPKSILTIANGITDSGEIVGEITDKRNSSVQGFLDNGGVFTTIRVAGAATTVATGINDSGEIVGDISPTKGTVFRVSWTMEGSSRRSMRRMLFGPRSSALTTPE